MDHGIIGMPFKLAMSSELSRRQFYSRAQAVLVERDQLRAEVEALRKDAERYRWLRVECGDTGCRALFIADICYSAEWDKAIDAAMAAKEGA